MARSATYLIDGDQVLAVFAMADAVRPESFDAVNRLHAAGLKVAMKRRIRLMKRIG